MAITKFDLVLPWQRLNAIKVQNIIEQNRISLWRVACGCGVFCFQKTVETAK